ncbi:lytic transglycosylase domain-containing protein [bacterium]|nr:lytic transglycosylase domain-containing protein [bacterium]
MEKMIFRGFISLAVFLSLAGSVFASSTEDVKQNIIRQAKSMGVEPAIVLSIAKTESGFNQAARGAGGHIGVFQLSHATAKHMGLNPYNLDENIKGGISYYKNMYNIFGSMELAVAAYNAGPEAVRRNNNTIPSSTRPFVNRIMNDYRYYKNSGI